MRSSQQQVPKGREPPRHGDLWTEQKRVRGCAGSAAERPVMPVKISNAPEPIPESVLSCKLPSVQIGRGVCVEMQVGVASKHFHLVFVLRSSTECGEATQSKYQQHFSQHKNPLLLKIAFQGITGRLLVADRAGEVRDTIFELVKNGPKGPNSWEKNYTLRSCRGCTDQPPGRECGRCNRSPYPRLTLKIRPPRNL